MTCKDCYHEFVCSLNQDLARKAICAMFKDKSRIVELPCKVGDKIYQTDFVRIYESTINGVILSQKKVIYDTNGVAFDETAIGKSIFLTREEAEEALRKERENDPRRTDCIS